MGGDVFHTTKENYVELFKDGSLYYNNYISAISNAKVSIHLQTYIFHIDDFGLRVHEALIQAALRGIKIYVLIDSVGSRLMEKKTEAQLVNAGVYFKRFNGIQIKWLYRWGRRLHHKILIVDHEIAFVGGINIVSGIDKKSGFSQLDFALLLKGPIVKKMTEYCQSLFAKSYPEKISFSPLKGVKKYPKGVQAKLLVNDWVHRRWHITRQYAQITRSAQKEITIINSYFFPRKSFMNQLVKAAKRGVRVRLILPQFSDWPNYILASEYLYDYFLKNNIEIYQWKKSILHGKMAVVDDYLTTLGSFNLNYTSYQQNLEMNINIYSPIFNKILKDQIEKIIKEGCHKIDPIQFENNCSFRKKFNESFFILSLQSLLIFQLDLFCKKKLIEKVAFLLFSGSSLQSFFSS